MGVAREFARPELAGMRSHGVRDFRTYIISIFREKPGSRPFASCMALSIWPYRPAKSEIRAAALHERKRRPQALAPRTG